jgi:hypothetical protein
MGVWLVGFELQQATWQALLMFLAYVGLRTELQTSLPSCFRPHSIHPSPCCPGVHKHCFQSAGRVHSLLAVFGNQGRAYWPAETQRQMVD